MSIGWIKFHQENDLGRKGLNSEFFIKIELFFEDISQKFPYLSTFPLWKNRKNLSTEGAEKYLSQTLRHTGNPHGKSSGTEVPEPISRSFPLLFFCRSGAFPKGSASLYGRSSSRSAARRTSAIPFSSYSISPFPNIRAAPYI